MKFRLATFNVENLDDDPDARPPLAERIAALRPLLERLAADILCLQEVNAHGPHGRPRSLAALDRLLAGTAYAGYARAVTLNEAGDNLRDLHNLVILSRFPILRHRQVQHELVPPPACAALARKSALSGASWVAAWTRTTSSAGSAEPGASSSRKPTPKISTACTTVANSSVSDRRSPDSIGAGLTGASPPAGRTAGRRC